jgi:hypothetical protein
VLQVVLAEVLGKLQLEWMAEKVFHPVLQEPQLNMAAVELDTTVPLRELKELVRVNTTQHQ